MSKFMKNDLKDNKPMMHLIETRFKEELAMLLTLGGFKYDFNNWKLAKDNEVIKYRDALERHMIAWDNGEIIDTDTGLPHTIAIAFNSMALHYFNLKFGAETGNRQLYVKQLNKYKRLNNERV